MKLKKHLGLLAAVVTISSGANSVVACGSTKQEVTPVKVELKNDLKQTDLGDFSSPPNGTYRILKRLGELNPLLDLESLQIIDFNNSTLTAIVRTKKTGKYLPDISMDLTYHLGAGEKRQNLSELFKTTYLGTFKS